MCRLRRPRLECLATGIRSWWPGVQTFIETNLTNAVSEGCNRVGKPDAKHAYGCRNSGDGRLWTWCANTRRVRGCRTTTDLIDPAIERKHDRVADGILGD
ncbi:transposase [Plantactinospora soyae]|uniref:transposase n=1 Tax=Plantactinospora soyae TaxID=1544732 RepID=UPI00178BFBA5